MAAVCLACGLAPARAHARAFEVKRLRARRGAEVWGTDEFQVELTRDGVLRRVAARGQQLLWLAALYTSPVPPGASKGVRTVQGETPGRTGLSLAHPERRAAVEPGARVFTFVHRVANPRVLDGRTLCEVTQRVRIAADGRIDVLYDCRWTQTLRWHGFAVILFFPRQGLPGREFFVYDADGRVLRSGRWPAPSGMDRLRGRFGQASIWAAPGPFHILLPEPVDCALTWAKSSRLDIRPLAAPYRSTVFKGQRGRIHYRLLLPVTQ